MFKKFPGKTILFGEYTIIAGSKALVLPFRRFSGRLDMPEEPLGSMESGNPTRYAAILKSNDDLFGILQYLERLQESVGSLNDINTGLFKEQLVGGLFFDSSIPTGYGAGSSGALVAAIYDAFGPGRSYESMDLSELRLTLGQMESFYHGTSSGIDPLCCYIDKPVLFDGDLIYPVNVPTPPPGSGFFLLDSGHAGETGPLVDYFKRRIQEPEYLEIINERMIPLVEKSIDLLLESDSRLWGNLRSLSEMQYTNFRRMIPEAVHKIWLHGLHSGLYSLKLCGSGGGGYIIGYTIRWIEAMQYFNKPGIRLLPLDV